MISQDALCGSEKIVKIYNCIRDGAIAFLFAEYSICFVFIVLFGAVVCVLTAYGGGKGHTWDWKLGGLTAAAFAIGGITSILCFLT